MPQHETVIDHVTHSGVRISAALAPRLPLENLCNLLLSEILTTS